MRNKVLIARYKVILYDEKLHCEIKSHKFGLKQASITHNEQELSYNSHVGVFSLL